MLLKLLQWLSQPRLWKDEACCVLSLCVFLSYVDLFVSGHVLIEMATTVTTVTPSAALVLFPTDSDDLERGNDSGTPLPTSDNDDNSLGYTGRVHLSKIFILAYCSHLLPTSVIATCTRFFNHLCYLAIFIIIIQLLMFFSQSGNIVWKQLAC